MWIEPKVDWQYNIDQNGNYTGDRFNAEDYNRIKNNSVFLKDLLLELYIVSDTVGDLGKDLIYSDYVYADMIMKIEGAIYLISDTMEILNMDRLPICTENGRFLTVTDLNKIESTQLKLYKLLTGQLDGIKKLSFTLGGGIFG